MTIIAYRDGVLACDTGTVRGNSRTHTRVAKTVRAPDGRLAAACGFAGYMGKFLAWALTGEGEPPSAVSPQGATETHNTGVVFLPGGCIHVYEDTGMHEATAPYYAIGSGSPEAMGAMFMGATAEEAVRAAMHHDSSCYGDVIVLRHAEPLKEAAE
jgi:hypothetical protein